MDFSIAIHIRINNRFSSFLWVLSSGLQRWPVGPFQLSFRPGSNLYLLRQRTYDYTRYAAAQKFLIKTFSYKSQWCSWDGNLRDPDLVKTSRPRLHQKLRDSRLEIREGDRNSRLKNLCILLKIFWNVVITSELNFFKFLPFFRYVLVVSYLPIQRTKIVELLKFYDTIYLYYSKPREL